MGGYTPSPIARLNNRHHVFEIDTSEAHSDEAVGLATILKDAGVSHANYLLVVAVGGGFSYKVNSTTSPSNDASVGEEWERYEITEIYVTNAATAGTAKIHVEYRVK